MSRTSTLLALGGGPAVAAAERLGPPLSRNLTEEDMRHIASVVAGFRRSA